MVGAAAGAWNQGAAKAAQVESWNLETSLSLRLVSLYIRSQGYQVLELPCFRFGAPLMFQLASFFCTCPASCSRSDCSQRKGRTEGKEPKECSGSKLPRASKSP